MARIVPTGPDTFQYIEDDKEQVNIETEQPRARIGAPFDNGMGQPLTTGGGYSARQSGWDIASQEMTGPDTFQVTGWRNRHTGEEAAEAPKQRYLTQEQWDAGMRDHDQGYGYGRDTSYYAPGGAGGVGGVRQQGQSGSTGAGGPGPPYEFGSERSGSSYRVGAGIEPQVQRTPGAGPPYEFGNRREYAQYPGQQRLEPEVTGPGVVNGSRLEPEVTRYDPGYSLYSSQDYGRGRQEPVVQRDAIGSEPIPMYVPQATQDPGYSIYGQQRADPGYSLYGNQQPRLEPEVTGTRVSDLEPQVSGPAVWDPSLEPQVQSTVGAIPPELQQWADEHGIQITQQQIDQYNAIQQGGWK